MGLISKIFKQNQEHEKKPSVGDAAKATIEILKKWEDAHFPNTNNPSDTQIPDVNRYRSYRKETGETVSLAQIRLPLPQPERPKYISVLLKLKEFLLPDTESMLPALIVKKRKELVQEINRFRENLIKLEQLGGNLKEDSLFAEIERVFNTKLRVLHNELFFCKFENLGDAEYFYTITNRLQPLFEDMNELNTSFTDYMYALKNTEYENTKQDLETIRLKVMSMSEVAEMHMEESLGVL